MDRLNKKLKYPILMIHGIGYRDRKEDHYWGRISREYQRIGNDLYFGGQDAWGTIHNNALTLKEKINQITNETGADKINIIAHSKGGLEARYLASTLFCADKIASITTISTPHRGSKTMEILMKLPSPIMKFIGIFVDLFYRILGDKSPDFYLTCVQLTTKKMQEFNESVLDADNVYYQSYASVMRSPMSDILMAFQNLIVSHFEGENDGLVTPASAQWGDFKGVWRGNTKRGISHADVADLRRKPFSRCDGPGVRDIVTEYLKILSDLKTRGF